MSMRNTAFGFCEKKGNKFRYKMVLEVFYFVCYWHVLYITWWRMCAQVSV